MSDMEAVEAIKTKLPINPISLQEVSFLHPEDAECGGIPISIENGNYMCVKDNVNSATVGASRSGKTEVLVLPTVHLLSATKEKQHMIITDPKLELYKRSKPMLEERGYKVYLLDLIKPSRGNKWGMLNSIADVFALGTSEGRDRAIAAITNIANILYSEADDKDPYWSESAAAFFNATMLFFLEECFQFTDAEAEEFEVMKMSVVQGYEKESVLYAMYLEHIAQSKQKFTMKNYLLRVAELQEIPAIPPNNKKIRFDILVDMLPADSQIKALYLNVLSAEGKTKSTIISVFFSKIQVFQESAIRELMEGNEISYSMFLGTAPVALFMGIPDYIQTRHPLATICLEQMYQQIVEHMSLIELDKLPLKLNFILDEKGNMPALNNFHNRLTVCLGRNISYHLFLQAYEQLNLLYGEEEMEIILGNCAIKYYIQTPSPDTNEYFSKICGEKTVASFTRSGEVTNTFLTSINESIDERSIYTPTEIERVERWKIIVKVQRMFPIESNMLPAFACPFFGVPFRFDEKPFDVAFNGFVFNRQDTNSIILPFGKVQEESIFIDIAEEQESYHQQNIEKQVAELSDMYERKEIDYDTYLDKLNTLTDKKQKQEKDDDIKFRFHSNSNDPNTILPSEKVNKDSLFVDINQNAEEQEDFEKIIVMLAEKYERKEIDYDTYLNRLTAISDIQKK